MYVCRYVWMHLCMYVCLFLWTFEWMYVCIKSLNLACFKYITKMQDYFSVRQKCVLRQFEHFWLNKVKHKHNRAQQKLFHGPSCRKARMVASWCMGKAAPAYIHWAAKLYNRRSVDLTKTSSVLMFVGAYQRNPPHEMNVELYFLIDRERAIDAISRGRNLNFEDL